MNWSSLGDAVTSAAVGLNRRTPQEGFEHAIRTWEGGYQAIPEDVGNWITMPDGARRLIGTKYGVTPAALAKFRGIPVWMMTVKDMQDLTVDEAASVGLVEFYRGPRFDRLEYGPAVEVWVDIGWGSGPITAVRHMQRMIGAGDDGVIGPYTERAWYEWLNGPDLVPSLADHAEAVEKIRAWRVEFYRDLVRRRPANAIFLNGWINRANHYGVGGAWWALWTK